jgi:uncharacterized membrane protein
MTGIIIGIILTVALEGVILAATPLIMPPTECFTVTVPPSAKDDPRIRPLFRAHTAIVAACTLVGIVCLAFLLPTDDDMLVALGMAAATVLPITASFMFMLHARKVVHAIKREEGWTASPSHTAAIISDDTIPQPIPLAWELLHLAVVLALVAYALLAYDRLPDQIPMHAGFDGTVTDYAEKSLRVVMFPALVAAFMGVAFAFTHWSIIRSKRPVDPEAPATSALAYGQFARAQSIAMLVGGLLLSCVIGVAFFLSSMGAVTLGTAGLVVTIAALLFVVPQIWISLHYGQAGGRLAGELRGSDNVARDDDERWVLGIFYCNRDDPSIFVPKRFGSGWTLNYGSSTAWVTIALFALVCAGFAVASLIIAG